MLLVLIVQFALLKMLVEITWRTLDPPIGLKILKNTVKIN